MAQAAADVDGLLVNLAPITVRVHIGYDKMRRYPHQGQARLYGRTLVQHRPAGQQNNQQIR
ncbi:MAG TPA: hypothetical protein VMW23_10845 [Sedimentisphaerales bacterium]|nr:hypothetical protein [Sedimentisphaerales bacterium]